MGEILVAYDDSEGSKKALNHAINIQKEGDELVLLYVVPSALIAEFAQIPPEIPVAKAQEIISNLVSNLKVQGVKVVGIVREGDVANEILTACAEFNCNLIVIGASGKGASKLAQFTFGSVAEKVARNATRPVLIVR